MQLGAALILARSGSGAALSDFMPERERSAAPILRIGAGAERNSSFCRSANTLVPWGKSCGVNLMEKYRALLEKIDFFDFRPFYSTLSLV